MKRSSPERPADRDEDGTITLGPRRVPLPSTISAEARAYLRNGARVPALSDFPPPGDRQAWKQYVARADEEMLAQQLARASGIDCVIEVTEIAGVRACVARLSERELAERRHVVLFLHGGALVLGGGKSVIPAAALAAASSCRRVVAVDFRNPPDHPYPAALEDCLAVYRELLRSNDPAHIAVAGRSSGGNLAVALILRALKLGLPAPAALALFTPELDLTESGDTFATLLGLDVVLRGGLRPLSALYAGERSLADPAVSPLHAEIPRHFPPTFLQSGTRDLFLSNTILMHRKLRKHGIAAELHVWEAMPHGGFGGQTPEDEQLATEYRHFLAKHLASQTRP